MTIKQQGGVFGRNPTFNNVDVEGDLNVGGSFSINGEVLSGLDFEGTWDANANSPNLTTITPVTGQFWIVSTGGATDLDGITNWGVGDWALYDGSTWRRIEGGADGNFVNLDASGTVSFAGAAVSDLGSVATADIDGGTIDGTVIGGTTPAAISGTTGQFDTSLNVDGTITSDGLTVVSGSYNIIQTTEAPTLDNDTHAGEALWIRSGGTSGLGNVQAVLGFGKADSGSLRTGAAIASVQTDSDADKVGIQLYRSYSSASSQTMAKGFELAHNGNISFYEDTGTTPKFFWDASAERLGIGTSSPDTLLTIQGSDAQVYTATGTLTNLLKSNFSTVANADTTVGAAALQLLTVAGASGTSFLYHGAIGGGAGATGQYVIGRRVSGSDYAESLRIDASGNMSLATGNLVLANGAGIDFSATAGTGTSELFDDYEEGTWTPSVIGATSGSMSFGSVPLARYTKVGRIVSITLYMTGGDFAAHTVSGNVLIQGLPYSASSAGAGVISVAFCNLTTADEADITISGYVEATSLRLLKGSSTSAVTGADLLSSGTNGAIMLSIVYETGA